MAEEEAKSKSKYSINSHYAMPTQLYKTLHRRYDIVDWRDRWEASAIPAMLTDVEFTCDPRTIGPYLGGGIHSSDEWFRPQLVFVAVGPLFRGQTIQCCNHYASTKPPRVRVLYTAAHSDDNTNQAMCLCNTVRIHNHLVTPDHNVWLVAQLFALSFTPPTINWMCEYMPESP